MKFPYGLSDFKKSEPGLFFLLKNKKKIAGTKTGNVNFCIRIERIILWMISDIFLKRYRLKNGKTNTFYVPHGLLRCLLS